MRKNVYLVRLRKYIRYGKRKVFRKRIRIYLHASRRPQGGGVANREDNNKNE